MDAGASFTYMLKQDGFITKLLIGGVLMFIPILGWALVAGYALRTMRAVSDGDSTLPEWTDWGDLFIKGLLMWVVSLVFNVPGLILGRLGAVGSLLSALWSIVVLVVLPAALLRFATRDNFAAAFEFSAIIDFIKANSSNYILAIILGVVASIIAAFGVILVVIGLAFTYFWAAMVWSHLMGSVYRASGSAAGSGVTRV
jgi:Protein of unknown function (DUF4013)